MRLRRLAWRLAVSVSLLVAAATGAAWVRSYCASDVVNVVRLDRAAHYYGVEWGGGQMDMFCAHSYRHRYAPQRPGFYWWSNLAKPSLVAPVSFWTSKGFYRWHDHESGTFHVTFPLWLPLALSSILPLVALRSAVRRHVRQRRGLCPYCGYDLRATPGRCPECGHEPGMAGGGAASANAAEPGRL